VEICLMMRGDIGETRRITSTQGVTQGELRLQAGSSALHLIHRSNLLTYSRNRSSARELRKQSLEPRDHLNDEKRSQL
jgi:hypothetical protein